MAIHKIDFEAVPNITIPQKPLPSNIPFDRDANMSLHTILSLQEIGRQNARPRTVLARPFKAREDVYAMFDANWSGRTIWNYPTLGKEFACVTPQQRVDMFQFRLWLSPSEKSFIQRATDFAVQQKVYKWLASESSQKSPPTSTQTPLSGTPRIGNKDNVSSPPPDFNDPRHSSMLDCQLHNNGLLQAVCEARTGIVCDGYKAYRSKVSAKPRTSHVPSYALQRLPAQGSISTNASSYVSDQRHGQVLPATRSFKSLEHAESGSPSTAPTSSNSSMAADTQPKRVGSVSQDLRQPDPFNTIDTTPMTRNTSFRLSAIALSYEPGKKAEFHGKSAPSLPLNPGNKQEAEMTQIPATSSQVVEPTGYISLWTNPSLQSLPSQFQKLNSIQPGDIPPVQRQCSYKSRSSGSPSKKVTFIEHGMRAGTNFVNLAAESYEYKTLESTNMLNSYFNSQGVSPPAEHGKEALEKMFDSYRGQGDDATTVGAEGTMRYFTEDLQLNIENAELLIPLEICRVEEIGFMNKDGFVEGWKAVGCETLAKQKAYIAAQIKALSTDMALYKRVYRYVFVCAKEKGQKALPLDTATAYWQVLFAPPGKTWATSTTDWTALWYEFLAAKWTKSVNRDMWHMTLEFLQKAVQDESLSFWNEDGAWPSVIDEFVVYAKEKKGKSDMETG